MNTDTAHQGSLMQIESGEYSDYHIMGFFVVLQEFKPLQEVEEYVVSTLKRDEHGDIRHYFDNNQFLAFLLKKGLLLEIEPSIFHLTDYGRVSECNFTPRVSE